MLVRRDVLTDPVSGIAASLLPIRAFAETGVTVDTIMLGQAAVFDGAASALGLGLLAAFAEVNAKGGVQGFKFELPSQDDRCEPNKSIDASEAMIAKNVFAFVGTPTSMATHPIATEAGAPSRRVAFPESFS